MLYIVKRKIFNNLILLFVVFSFSGVASAASVTQEVYFTEKSLHEIVARLQEQGRPKEMITSYLKKNLRKMTPKLAKEKFGIEWIDNKVNQMPKFNLEYCLNTFRK